MRKIAHLSDVHFGTVDPGVADRVVAAVNEISPDVLVLSGDLTQRARSREFIAARRFLDQLPKPQIVVPGNHDVPLYNVFARFFWPMAGFQKHISSDLTPTFFDDELAIVGVNTARSFVIKGGRINHEQMDFIQSQMCALNDDILKIVVTHHPFDLPENSHHSEVVGRADEAMPVITSCGGDVLLAGHLHVSHIETTAKRYKLDTGRIALVIQAGTATSTRVRGEHHSFNLIEWDRPRIRVSRYEDNIADTHFKVAESKTYDQTATGWDRIE